MQKIPTYRQMASAASCNRAGKTSENRGTPWVQHKPTPAEDLMLCGLAKLAEGQAHLLTPTALDQVFAPPCPAGHSLWTISRVCGVSGIVQVVHAFPDDEGAPFEWHPPGIDRETFLHALFELSWLAAGDPNALSAELVADVAHDFDQAWVIAH